MARLILSLPVLGQNTCSRQRHYIFVRSSRVFVGTLALRIKPRDKSILEMGSAEEAKAQEEDLLSAESKELEVKKRLINILGEQDCVTSLSPNRSTPNKTLADGKIPGVVLHTFPGQRIPARFVLVAMLFSLAGLSYIIRADLSLTIIAMLNQTALDHEELKNNTPASTDVCYFHNESDQAHKPKSDLKDGEFVWDPTIVAVVHGSFFYGYTCTQLVGGRLSDRFGPKRLLTVCMSLACLFTVLVPVAARLGVYVLVAVRVLTGMTQGVVFPAVAAFFARWIPFQERSRHYTIVLSGTTLALVASMPIAAALCESSFIGGWPSVFYVFGLMVAVWVLLWILLIYNTPTEHPRISEDEVKLILESLPKIERFPVPWKRMIMSFPVWAMVISMAAGSWVFNTVMAELPTYLDQVLNYPINQNGLINSFLYLVTSVACILGGFIADYLQNKGWLKQTTIRKVMDGIALVGSAACFAGMALSRCNASSVLTLLFMSTSLLSFQNSGSAVAAIDMSPNFSGTLYGLTNTFYSIVGFLAPLATGLYTEKGPEQLQPWSYVFYTTAGVEVLGFFAFLFFGSADVQPWDRDAQMLQMEDPGITEIKQLRSNSD